MTGNEVGVAALTLLTAAWFIAWHKSERTDRMTIWTAGFWKALAERVIATFLMAFLGVVAADGFDFRHANWSDILLAAAIAAGLSVAKGILANIGTKNGPGLTSSEQVVPPEPQPK